MVEASGSKYLLLLFEWAFGALSVFVVGRKVNNLFDSFWFS